VIVGRSLTLGRTIVRFYVPVKNRRLSFALGSRAARPGASIWVVAVMQRQQDLHKIMPDGLFWNKAVVFLGLLDHGGQVSPSAILHEYV
jgi:hypothetical protein